MRLSVSSFKNMVILLLIIVVCILLFENYLAIHDRNIEWVTSTGEAGSISRVEFRPNISELQKLLVDKNATLVEAVTLRLDEIVSPYPYSLQDCKVVSMQGSLSHVLIVQFDCLKLNRIATDVQ